jgi:hypothetical protein
MEIGIVDFIGRISVRVRLGAFGTITMMLQSSTLSLSWTKEELMMNLPS